MNMKFAAVAAVAALGTLSIAVSPQAAAADNGFYLGAGLTQSDYSISVDGFAGEESFDDNAFKLIAGLRPLDWLAIEANYIDLGTIDFDDGSGVTIDSKAITASALFIKEFQVIDLFAKVGLAKWDTKFNLAGLGSVDDDGWEPIYGVGIGAHFGSLGLRAEWERLSTEALDDEIDTDVDTISLSFTYTFL